MCFTLYFCIVKTTSHQQRNFTKRGPQLYCCL